MLKYSLFACLAFSAVQCMAQELPYSNQTEIAILVGEQTTTALSAQTFNGVRIKKWNAEIGITAGVDGYESMVVLPVSIGFKWNPLPQKEVSPYISLNAGYGFDWLQRRTERQLYSGGYLLAPQAGIRIKTKQRAKIMLSLGYRQQYAEMIQTSLFYDYLSSPGQLDHLTEAYTFRRLFAGVGLSF